MEQICNNIDYFRREQKLKIQDVQDDLGITADEYVSYITNPDLPASVAVKFANYFACTVGQLISTEPISKEEQDKTYLRIFTFERLEKIDDLKALELANDLVKNVERLCKEGNLE